MKTLNLKNKITKILKPDIRYNSLKNKKYWYPLSIGTYDIEEISSALESLINFRTSMSLKTKKFENLFSKFVKTKYSTMVNSGSSADLLLAQLLSSNFNDKIKKGDEILVPCITWPTHIWSIFQAGFVPKLVDIDKRTLNICYDDLQNKISKKTKAIFIVHLMGNPCNMKKINFICNKNKLILLEDCCEALGARWGSKHVGNFGIGGSFSFFFSHHLVTMEGGMIVTNKKILADQLKIMRSHGWARDLKKNYPKYKHIDPRYLFVSLGYNLRPTELQAAFGIEQLKKISLFNKKRNKLANIFFKSFKNNKYIYTPTVDENAFPCWFALPIIIKNPKKTNKLKFTQYLEKKGIECRPIVVGDISRQPIKELYPKVFNKYFPNARYIDKNAFYIGLSPMYNESQIYKLIKIFNNFFQNIEKNSY